jgi:tetratricopeptide (TPR) repeat protein
MADRVGQCLGNYRLVSLLGQGGYAEVYLGQHVRLSLQAAIKVLHAHLSEREAEHFSQEAQIIARLSHPSIVRVFDYDVQEGVPFLVMDYAPGGSLRRRYPRGSQVALPLLVSSVKQVAAALQYAHEQQVIHRDIKPENMLLGRREEVLLSDFGLAALSHSSGSLSTKEAVGTLAYMAPEQIEGWPRAASDQYALGVVVYEWLCGSRPFEGSATEVLVQQLTMPPPPLHERVSPISHELEQVVLRALAKDPKERFDSVAAFAEALETASQTGHTSGARPQTVQRDAAATRPAVERPWNVPFGRNPFFTGRGQLLERLHAELSRSQRVALNQSYALSGLGGIGKTQTAIEYAYRYREEYSAVFWVRAESRETLIADYVAIARLLSLPGADAQDQSLIVAATKRWLEQHEGWLLILDNADELTLLPDFLPTGGQGRLLLTTRAQATGKLAEALPVEKMERFEGIQLLLRRAKLLALGEPLDSVSAAVRTVAQQLVEELDGLPLALEQAAAYIEEIGCTPAEYLALFHRHRLALLKRPSTLSSEYPHTVASTWALSFAQVEQVSPAAAELLRVCAFLHPDAIPEAMLTEGARELGPMLEPVATDSFLFNEAIQVLRRYSLIKRDPEMKVLNLHRLVQVVLKEQMDQAAKRHWAERTVRMVNAAFPEASFEAWTRCERYLPQVQACAELIEEHRLSFPEAARLLHQAGVYLRERGIYEQAESFLQCALSIFEQVVGPESPETGSVHNDLARLYYYQGKYEQAEPLLKRALSLREQVLGSEHPETASTLNNLAWLYSRQSRYTQAEPLFQRALAIHEQTSGTRHSETATTLNGLGMVYLFQGKYEQAEPLLQRALAIHEQVLEPFDPEVAVSLNNLAMNYFYQARYEQADPLFQQALNIREQVLGPEHPDVAQSLDNLAALYRSQGKYTQAEPLQQRALSIYEQALGPEHPDTFIALYNLAQLYQSLRQYERAESLYQRALPHFERVFGPEHLRVGRGLHSLAQLYTVQGKYEQAEPLYQRALKIGEQTLGPEHPETARIRADYTGFLLTQQGKSSLTGLQETTSDGSSTPR